MLELVVEIWLCKLIKIWELWWIRAKIFTWKNRANVSKYYFFNAASDYLYVVKYNDHSVSMFNFQI
jgi:hypothetical protein